jgi:putative transposase
MCLHMPRSGRKNQFENELIMLRRHKQLSYAGSVHFITTVTTVRGRWFVSPSVCTDILSVFENVRADLGIACLGYVLMPDHFHALLVQRDEGMYIAEMMRRFKRKTSTAFHPVGYSSRSLWQRRYDDVLVPGSDAVWTKLNYIHQNPVKAKLATTAEAYPYSSARDFANIQSGIVKIASDLIPMLMP